jgi:hypothetical protein
MRTSTDLAEVDAWQTVRRGPPAKSSQARGVQSADVGDERNVSGGGLSEPALEALRRHVHAVVGSAAWARVAAEAATWLAARRHECMDDVAAHPRVRLTCIGLGNVASASLASGVLVQLAFLLLLRHELAGGSGTSVLSHGDVVASLVEPHVGGKCEGESEDCCPTAAGAARLYDTGFTPADVRMLRALGFEALAVEGGCPCDGQADGLCVLFMPHCPLALNARVVWQHWDAEGEGAMHEGHRLSQLLLICNSFRAHVSAAEGAARDDAAALLERERSDAVVALCHLAPACVTEVPLDPLLTASACRDEDVRHALGPALSSTSLHSFSACPARPATLCEPPAAIIERQA